MKKQLGGNRLGSGNKNSVDLHGYERSTHDLGYIYRTTMSSGTLVPFIKQIAEPGSTFDINLKIDGKTHPTVGPCFGSFKIQGDIFLIPMRLYNPRIHNNPVGLGRKMNIVKFPILKFPVPKFTASDITDVDNCQINPSSIMSHLGIRGLGIANTAVTTPSRDFYAGYLLGYWDIVKNFYANKQEENAYVIHNTPVADEHNVTTIDTDDPQNIPLAPGVAIPPVAITGTTIITITYSGTQDLNQIIFNTSAGKIKAPDLGTVVLNIGSADIAYNQSRWGNTMHISNWEYTNAQTLGTTIGITSFPLKNIDDMRETILSEILNTAPFNVFDQGISPYSLLIEQAGENRALMGSQEGLALKTYQSDLFNNWLNTEFIDGTGGITELTSVDTTSGSFSMDTLIFAKKLYNYYNRILVSGDTVDDWIDASWATERFSLPEIPMYMGGISQELEFQEVVSLAEAGQATNTGQPLGTLAGKGVVHRQHKGGQVTIKVDEPSMIMGILSITPRLDYSQGNDWDVNLETWEDLHKPEFDGIGFQELITQQMAWWDTFQDPFGTWELKSAGKQPAWINYMTEINKIKGNFAIDSNEGFMVLTRRYEALVNPDNRFDIKDLTTYIDPTKFNHIFAETSLDAQNFWIQVGVDMTVRRKISAKIMPNL